MAMKPSTSPTRTAQARVSMVRGGRTLTFESGLMRFRHSQLLLARIHENASLTHGNARGLT